MKFLYHDKQLFKIVSEKATYYKIQKCETVIRDYLNKCVNLIPSTFNDYVFIGCFKLDNTSICNFDKKENNYLIIENFNIFKNHLLVRFISGKLSYEEVSIHDFVPIKRTELMLCIIENFKSIYNFYKTTRRNDNSYSFALLNNDFEHMLNQWKDRYYTQILISIEHPQVDDIRAMMETRGVPLEEMYDLVSEYERSEEDKVIPLLTQEQISKIRELKKQLPNDKDPMRKSWQYTNKELGVSSLILSICNNSKESYLLGLRQIFSKPRADAILRKLVS